MSRHNFKAETLARILDDANSVKPIPGYENSYEPGDYAKKRAEVLAMSAIEGNDGYLEPKVPIGAAEFDQNGNLKEISRNAPRMLDLAILTENRYDVENVIPANEKKVGLERGLYIVVVVGHAIVSAINNTNEIPKNIKAYRFKRVEVTGEVAEDTMGEMEVTRQAVDEEGKPMVDKDGKPIMVTTMEEQPVLAGEKATTYDWEYMGAIMIPSSRVYKMTRQIDQYDMLNLLQKIKEGVNNATNIEGDRLDSIHA